MGPESDTYVKFDKKERITYNEGFYSGLQKANVISDLIVEAATDSWYDMGAYVKGEEGGDRNLEEKGDKDFTQLDTDHPRLHDMSGGHHSRSLQGVKPTNSVLICGELSQE